MANDLVERLAAFANCEANELEDTLNEAAVRIEELERQLAEAREALSGARIAIEALAKIGDPNSDPSGVMNGPTVAKIDRALSGKGE